jgi:hypothetical protein
MELLGEREPPMMLDRRHLLKSIAAGTSGLAVSSSSLSASSVTRERTLDLDDAEDNFNALMKMRGDTTGKESTWWGTGTISSFVPGERSRRLFVFEIFSVSRFESYEEGYRLLHREFGVFRDPTTGKILDRWYNPFLDREVDVLHRFTDPVNIEFNLKSGRFRPPFPYIEHGDDIWFQFDLWFHRPSPITRKEFPLNVQSDIYEGGELYMWHVRRRELENPETTSAPATCGWARLGQWEPFMEMGNRPGMLVYRLAAKKMENGNDDLPEEIHQYATTHHPKFLSSPEEFTTPNESQWTAFKKHAEKKKKR